MRRLLLAWVLVVGTGCAQEDDCRGNQCGPRSDEPSGPLPPTGGDPDLAGPDEDGDGVSPAAGDCNDADPTIHAGAPEQCDAVDHDCDGLFHGGPNLLFRYDFALAFPYVTSDGDTDYGWSSLWWGRAIPDEDLEADPSLVDQRPWVIRVDAPLDGLFDERYRYVYSIHEGPDAIIGYRGTEALPYEEWTLTYQSERLVYAVYDRTLDGVIEATWNHVYTPSGGTVVDYDEGADGNIDIREYTAFDEHDRVVLYSEDYGADGRLEFEETWAYDGFDNVTHYTRDDDGDGRLDREEVSNFDVWGNGVWFTVDSDGDGVVDTRWEHDRDADGNLVDYRRDDDGDGEWDYLSVRTWSDGSLVRYVRDTDADGSLDYSKAYTYDALGNKLAYDEDEDGDGLIDVAARYSWNDQGELVQYTRDYGDDGSIDYRSTYGYDLDGWYSHRRTDSDMDGIDDVVYDVTCEGSIFEIDALEAVEETTWQP
ncbi:MAG: hypothetical protein ACI9K2_000639 [Myxococcota bacterium]|jgi:hypothetical protein